MEKVTLAIADDDKYTCSGVGITQGEQRTPSVQPSVPPQSRGTNKS